MPTVTESDLKEIKDLIIAGFNRIDNEIVGLKNEISGLKTDVNSIKADVSVLKGDITDLKITVATMEERLAGQINVVDEKVNGLGKRLDFQEFINRGVIAGAGLALITALANMLGFLPRG
jgi:hypothetical protein